MYYKFLLTSSSTGGFFLPVRRQRKTAALDYSDAAVKLLQMCDFTGILLTSTQIGIRLAHVSIQPSFSVS